MTSTRSLPVSDSASVRPVTAPGSSEFGALVRALRAAGVEIEAEPDTSSLLVAPRGDGGPTATLDIPEKLLGEYLDEVGRSYAPFDDVPRDSARGLVTVQIAGQLTADHGGGVNRVQRLTLQRDGGGLRFVEERADGPRPPPPTPDEPHDNPEVFARELDALAHELSRQGHEARADAASSTIEVGPRGHGEDARAVTIELRPDLYRRYLEAQEEEYEAIGGDPRELAWTAWCHLVGRLLVDGPPGAPGERRRLSLVTSPDGEVGLVPNAPGSEPPGPGYVWSADPGL